MMDAMNTVLLLERVYGPYPEAYSLLLTHSQMVTRRALQIAERVRELNPDFQFIEEAAMLHDIGIFMTNEPALGCFGTYPYIAHGYLGRELLEREGLLRHALVCERHVGVGITAEDIERNALPLPKRDMLPVTLEEKIICLADKFYSKHKETILKEKCISEVRSGIARYGDGPLKRFEALCRELKEPLS